MKAESRADDLRISGPLFSLVPRNDVRKPAKQL